MLLLEIIHFMLIFPRKKPNLVKARKIGTCAAYHLKFSTVLLNCLVIDWFIKINQLKAFQFSLF